MSQTGETFRNAKEALDVIGDGKFRLQRFTGGRPETIYTPEGDREWDRKAYESAVLVDAIPKDRLIFVPVSATGRPQSSKKISLDLSLTDESSVTMGSPEGGQGHDGMVPVGGVQDIVILTLKESFQDERAEVHDLREQLAEAQETITELKVKVAVLEMQLTAKTNHENRGIDAQITNWLEIVVKNGGLGLLAAKLGLPIPAQPAA